MSIFNDYGVLINDDILSNVNKTFDTLRAFLASEPELTLQELMILERCFHGSVSGAFADRILRQAVFKRKAERDNKKNQDG